MKNALGFFTMIFSPCLFVCLDNLSRSRRHLSTHKIMIAKLKLDYLVIVGIHHVPTIIFGNERSLQKNKLLDLRKNIFLSLQYLSLQTLPILPLSWFKNIVGGQN